MGFEIRSKLLSVQGTRKKDLFLNVICVKFDLALRLSRMAFLSTQLLLDHADACWLSFVSVNA